MKRYYVTVNGNRYQVEVEEVSGEFEDAAPKATTAPAPKPAAQQPPMGEMPSAPAPKPAAKRAPEDGEKINCPMPGTIVNIAVKEGDSIKKGDLLFVLEAMKMENEIVSPVSGTVASIQVSRGQSVNTDDLLAVIS
jgi:biotin carboxyl carrier protein